VNAGEQVPDALAAAVVLDAAGRDHVLGALWAERDAIAIFVRHFACAGCAQHVAELAPRLADIASLGVAVALVGNGTPPQLADFIEREKLGEAMRAGVLSTFTDPSLGAYRAAGLERSWAGTVGPRALGNLAALLARGYWNGRARGDLAQQGGTLYVRRGGVLAFVHASARLGDHASVGDVVEIALAAHATEAGAFA
jgi:hypothetical protein